MLRTSGAPLAQVFAAAEAGVPLGQAAPELISVALDQIVPCRWQPRQAFDPAGLLDLANDIARHGILTPPLVWHNEDLEYEIIAGERRIRACYALTLWRSNRSGRDLAAWCTALAKDGFVSYNGDTIRTALHAASGLANIPCRQVWGKPSQLHELALVDNLQRADLSPLEEAHALHDLIQEYGYTQRDLAGRLGKSQTWISHRLNLLNLAPEVASQVAGGEVEPATAREIARLAPAAQPVMVAHLQKYGIKSKAAQNLIGRVIELSQPEYYAGPSSTGAGGAKRLTGLALEQLPDVGARQAAILRAADMKSGGQLRPPAESHEYRDIIAASGLGGAGADRYHVELEALWQTHSAAVGYICANCQINPHRGLVADVNELVRAHRDTHNYNLANWPRCAADVTTCQAYTATGERLLLPLPYLPSDFVYTEAEKAHMGEYAYGRSPVADVPIWAGILRRKYAQDDAAQAKRRDAKQNGLARALTEYATAQQAGELDLAHFWAQPCARCVFHKMGATDPAEMCQFQANPPAWDNWETIVVRLWRSGNAPAVPRCRLFRLKTPESLLPDLPGAGLDLFAPGLLYLLRQLADRVQYQQTVYAARWLDVKRTNAWEMPTWSTAAPYLERLLPGLTPGQRLALLLLWHDPFDWRNDNSTPANAYVPDRVQAFAYTVQQEFRR